MIRSLSAVVALSAAVAFAAPAHADASSRDIRSAVDGYLAGPADDSGFWIRGNDFGLRINLTLQARYEAFDYDEGEPGVGGIGGRGGDLSGFSLPRALVKLSGTAPCTTWYFVELDFGHFGRDLTNVLQGATFKGPPNLSPLNLGPTYYGVNGGIGADTQSSRFDPLREAWIEWCSCAAFNVRLGQILTPNTRQLMTAPELQQFVDISLASAFTGHLMPGYTDRNRDHGVMFHGTLGSANALSWMAAITNGDGGDSIRNAVDNRTSDGLALSARVNWAFLKPIHYEEGALRQTTRAWYGEAGAWAHRTSDRIDGPHTEFGTNLICGVDLALGYGGFSLTAAYTTGTQDDVAATTVDIDTTALLLQLGYLFPGTAWEIAARYSSIDVETSAGFDGSLEEMAGAINLYLDGHANKLSLDLALLDERRLNLNFFDVYTGISPPPGALDLAFLLRLQWQLAL